MASNKGGRGTDYKLESEGARGEPASRGRRRKGLGFRHGWVLGVPYLKHQETRRGCCSSSPASRWGAGRQSKLGDERGATATQDFPKSRLARIPTDNLSWTSTALLPLLDFFTQIHHILGHRYCLNPAQGNSRLDPDSLSEIPGKQLEV